MTKSRAILIICLCVALVIAHVVGLSFEFYWRIAWYDRVVHVLAGATTVLVALSFGVARRAVERPFTLFLAALAISLAVGILWEVFELKANVTNFSDHGYIADTVWDIGCDVIGGFIAGWYLFLFS